MKKRFKLLLSILILCVSISCLAFGVYAATMVDYVASGTIDYDAKDVYATISDISYEEGTVTSLTQNVSALSEINFNKTNKLQAEQIASWNNLKLKFNDNGDDIVITFKVQNLNHEYSLKFAGEKSHYDYTENNVDCNIVVKDMDNNVESDITNIIIPTATEEVNGFVTVQITFSLVNKLTGANVPNFNIPFTLDFINK